MSNDENLPESIAWEGRFIVAKTRGKWEYVSRTRGIHAAVILAMASASGTIGQPQALAAPVESAAASSSSDAPVAANPPLEAITGAREWTGANGGGWLVAAATAAALIVVQGFSTWRLRSWPGPDMPHAIQPPLASRPLPDPPGAGGV